jgi:cytochrome P450
VPRPHTPDCRPDEIDLTRSPSPHLSFRRGSITVSAQSMARLEAAVAIPAILQQLPDLELAGHARKRHTFILRGFTQLPIRWRT